MVDTDVSFQVNCPAGQTFSDALSEPRLKYTIVPTEPPCDDNHRNHLRYVQKNNTVHQKVYSAEFHVPADELIISIDWRPRVVEQITTTRTGHEVQHQQTDEGGVTTLRFPVPAHNTDAALNWMISNGAPGFRLKVTVKRK